MLNILLNYLNFLRSTPQNQSILELFVKFVVGHYQLFSMHKMVNLIIILVDMLHHILQPISERDFRKRVVGADQMQNRKSGQTPLENRGDGESFSKDEEGNKTEYHRQDFEEPCSEIVRMDPGEQHQDGNDANIGHEFAADVRFLRFHDVTGFDFHESNHSIHMRFKMKVGKFFILGIEIFS